MAGYPTYEEALAKLQRYCAYQERCHHEVRTKLLQLKVYGDTLEEVISALVQEGFLNEQRFAETFTSGKYRLKAWGRNKIKKALYEKYVSAYCIKKAMASIDEIEYLAVLERALDKYLYRWRHLDTFSLRGRAFKYAMNKGYSFSEVNPILDRLLADEQPSTTMND